MPGVDDSGACNLCSQWLQSCTGPLDHIGCLETRLHSPQAEAVVFSLLCLQSGESLQNSLMSNAHYSNGQPQSGFQPWWRSELDLCKALWAIAILQMERLPLLHARNGIRTWEKVSEHQVCIVEWLSVSRYMSTAPECFSSIADTIRCPSKSVVLAYYIILSILFCEWSGGPAVCIIWDLKCATYEQFWQELQWAL